MESQLIMNPLEYGEQFRDDYFVLMCFRLGEGTGSSRCGASKRNSRAQTQRHDCSSTACCFLRSKRRRNRLPVGDIRR